MAILYPLYSRSSNLSLPNKLLLFKQVLRPIMTYGSLVWGTAAKTSIERLQTLQNKYLRLACDAPIRTNMHFLQEELGIEEFATYIKNSNRKKIEKAENHSNTLVKDSLSYIPAPRIRRNRPRSVLLPPPVP